MRFLKFPLLLSLVAAGLVVQAQFLTFIPEKPLAGETITVTYDKHNAPLAKAESFYMTALTISNGNVTLYDVTLTEENGIATGAFRVPQDADLVYFAPKAWGQDLKDENGGIGYGSPVYQPGRTQVVPGYEISKGALLNRYFYFAGLERNDKEALSLWSKRFDDLKSNRQNLIGFAFLVSRMKNEPGKAQILGYARQLANKANASEQEMALALALSETLEDEALSKMVEDKLNKKYPKLAAWKKQADRFYQGGLKLEEQKSIFNQLAASPYAALDDSPRSLSRMASRLTAACYRDKDWADFEKYAAQISSPLDRASTLNSLAWRESGESLEAPGGDLERARKISWETLQTMKAAMENPAFDKDMEDYSPWERRKILEMQYAMFADTYALILYKLGKNEEALQYQQIACESDKFQSVENNERYCAYLEAVKGAKAAETKLEELISLGYANAGMKAQFKRLFEANHSPEQAAGKYLTLLEKEARLKLKEKVKEKMIDEEAPAFTLRNLQGETVDLASLKGKVAVLDFWATWCGPCIMSFPGMQRAQNAHQERDDVVFLFIDTWESAQDKEKNARDFIEKNNYSFHVLMDTENEVVSKFKVEGIPTKFVLDRKGRIRFRSVGYGGNDDALVDEMAFMIELAGGI